MPPSTAQPALPDEFDALARTRAPGQEQKFADLLALVAGESNFRPDALNRHTGAAGPFQFVRSTWLSLLRAHGAELGVKPDLVAQIEEDAKGRPVVADPAVLKSLLALRSDLSLSANAASKYLDDNKVALARQLHREPSDAEVQMSFLLGVHGAVKLIRAASHTPHVSAASVVPHAAAANRSLFYHRAGGPRTAAQAVAFLTAKYQSSKAKYRAYLTATEALPAKKLDA